MIKVNICNQLIIILISPCMVTTIYKPSNPLRMPRFLENNDISGSACMDKPEILFLSIIF